MFVPGVRVPSPLTKRPISVATSSGLEVYEAETAVSFSRTMTEFWS